MDNQFGFRRDFRIFQGTNKNIEIVFSFKEFCPYN